MTKILIVDDEQDFVETIEFFLTRKKFKVATANNGKEALKKVEADKPDLILLDIMMPSMDGITTCRQLKSFEDSRNIPIIMLTAKGQKEDVTEALSSGANDYIVKPFDFDELVSRIRKVLSIGIGYSTI